MEWNMVRSRPFRPLTAYCEGNTSHIRRWLPTKKRKLQFYKYNYIRKDLSVKRGFRIGTPKFQKFFSGVSLFFPCAVK